jgi:hypothetical protein
MYILQIILLPLTHVADNSTDNYFMDLHLRLEAVLHIGLFPFAGVSVPKS